MNVEFYWPKDHILGKMTQKQTKNINDSVGKELKNLGDLSIQTLENAKNTLVVDVLEISEKGALMDSRLFDSTQMPISGKMTFWEVEKIADFLSPKSLANHCSSLVQQLCENAKMLK